MVIYHLSTGLRIRIRIILGSSILFLIRLEGWIRILSEFKIQEPVAGRERTLWRL
jgi:hypothetical protein